MLVQAPVGVTEADVAVVLQALLDRHAMLRLRVDDDGAGGWSLTVPEAGSVDARACLQTVDVLSDEAVIAARSRLDPTAGVMLSALWVVPTAQLVVIIHHLAVDGVSWRILLEDLNSPGPSIAAGSRWCCPPEECRLPGGRRCWPSTRAAQRSLRGRIPGGRSRQCLRRLPAVQPAIDTYASAGQLVGGVGRRHDSDAVG